MAKSASPRALLILIQRILHRPLYRYLIIGGSVYVFELVVIATSQAFGASSLVAVSLSFWLGLVVSFWLQKLVTFSDRRMMTWPPKKRPFWHTPNLTMEYATLTGSAASLPITTVPTCVASTK